LYFLIEMLPLILFFIAFKLYEIYIATMVGIIATLTQVLVTRYWRGKWDRTQIITFCVFLLFGGMTLYFHNPIFVKWKPTIIFAIFALIIICSQLFTHKPMMQRLMEKIVEDKGHHVPAPVWKRINFMWALFFITLAAINLFVAYTFSNDVWVNFKVFGISSALLIASIMQAVCLTRYITHAN
jgi:intracellular septation protein